MYIVSNYSVLLFRKDAKNIPLCLNKIARYKKIILARNLDKQ